MLTDYIYITKARALEVGLTHQGHMYGAPAWFDSGDQDDEFAYGTPKVPVLHLWCMLAGALFWFLDSIGQQNGDTFAPIEVKGRIK